MKEEFNLSEKIKLQEPTEKYMGFNYLKIKDVKEFIKLLKEELRQYFDEHDDFDGYYWEPFINKLAGEKLNA